MEKDNQEYPTFIERILAQIFRYLRKRRERIYIDSFNIKNDITKEEIERLNNIYSRYFSYDKIFHDFGKMNQKEVYMNILKLYNKNTMFSKTVEVIGDGEFLIDLLVRFSKKFEM